MDETELTADPVELLHLALDAVDLGYSAMAIHYLKELLKLKPGSAEAHYLLATQQHRVGLRSRAIASLRTALAFQPQFDAARFKLGMLLNAAGQHQEARAIWGPLDKLPGDDPFHLFTKGLLCLADGRTEQGTACLQRGIALNHLNMPLNQDMSRIIARCRRKEAAI
jgi:tetratricopeptide (TPR) repeat protein